MLGVKLNTYEKFAKDYPGYGGFIPPYLEIRDDKVVPGGEWANMVSAYDNGELFWAIYGLVEILDVKYPS